MTQSPARTVLVVDDSQLVREVVRDLINDIELHGNTVIDASKDCGPTGNNAAFVQGTNDWTFRERRAAVFTRGNATAAQANATFPCIENSNDAFLAGTDIIAIKRLSSATASLTAGKPYLRTNGVETTLSLAVAGTPTTTGATDPAGTVCNPADVSDDATCTVTIYEYRPVVWYIRPWSVSASESPRIPALCRMVFSDGTMKQDAGGCVASGIANMQLEFGFDVPDATGRYDGLADNFQEIGAPLTVSNMTDPHPMAFVVAVRIHLLAQSTQRDVDYRNTKTYQLAGLTVGPFDDGFYRKSLSSTVLVRNVMNRLSPYSLPSY